VDSSFGEKLMMDEQAYWSHFGHDFLKPVD